MSPKPADRNCFGPIRLQRHGRKWLRFRVDRLFGPEVRDPWAVIGGHEHGPMLDLGCGPAPRKVGTIGIDLVPTNRPCLVWDLQRGLPFVRSRSVPAVRASHVLEHVADLDIVLAEISRVLTTDGSMVAIVPHFSNPYYFSDPTHVRPFGLYSFCYLAEDEVGFRRRVPHYRDSTLVLKEVQLRFRPQSRRGRRWRSRFERWVNAHPSRQEFYERTLHRVVPCDEIRAVLEVRGR